MTYETLSLKCISKHIKCKCAIELLRTERLMKLRELSLQKNVLTQSNLLIFPDSKSKSNAKTFRGIESI